MLDPTKVINGTFGEVWHEGNWVTNVKSAEATVDIGKEEIPVSGSRWIGHKQTSLTGTGNITSYKLTSEFIQMIGSIAEGKGTAFVTELILKLDDPDSYGAERVRLKGVQFDTIPLGKFELNAIVEEELPFTFSGYELLDKIEQA